MVKYYYETTEIKNSDDSNPALHILVYGNTKQECIDMHDTYKTLLSGKSYKARVVECRHDEGEPCIETVVEEV